MEGGVNPTKFCFRLLDLLYLQKPIIATGSYYYFWLHDWATLFIFEEFIHKNVLCPVYAFYVNNVFC